MGQRERIAIKFKKYWPLLFVIVILLAGFSVYSLFKSEPESDTISNITTSTIRAGEIRVSAFGNGSLISASEVELGFEYGGVVEEILVEIGDVVIEGQILATLDDEKLIQNLEIEQAVLRELTSAASVAAAALELAEAQKAVLSAESELRFLISPYVFKSELRLREAQVELQNANSNANINPSEEADQRIAEAQEAVDHATLSLALNWETYAEEYVPDFFNFRWRDAYGFWHDYYYPPSETEVAVVWAELAAAEAWVEEAEAYLAALTDSEIPDDAYGSQLVKLEKAGKLVSDAQEALDASRLVAPVSGMIVESNIQQLQSIGTKNVVTIAQLEPPTLEASFDESDWSLVKVGNSVEVIFDVLPEKTYQGKIVFVDPTLKSSQNSTMVSALVELDISQSGWANFPLLSGATVEVIAGEAQGVVLLPIEGLQIDDGDQGKVQLIQENGETVEQEIELGIRDVLFVEVTNGLSVGDVILIGSIEK